MMQVTIIILVVIIFVVFVATKLYLKPKVTTENDVKAGVLFAYYTKGNMLLPADRGKVNDIFYDTYVTMYGGPFFGEAIAPAGTVIYCVQLPFNTQGHMVGISSNGASSAEHVFAEDNGLVKVELEGDFNDHFTLYSPEDQAIQVRYIFDPAAMQFVVDFCSNHDWEIVYDELYFTVNEKQDAGPMVLKSLEFIKQIQPAIISEFPTKEALRQRVSYGEYRGNPLKCPICHTDMTYNTFWHECPKGHGRLLHAQKLLGFRTGQIKQMVAENSVTIQSRTKNLVCPFCNEEMVPTQYMKRGLVIDSCFNCPYRWLDTGELQKIIQKTTIK